MDMTSKNKFQLQPPLDEESDEETCSNGDGNQEISSPLSQSATNKAEKRSVPATSIAETSASIPKSKYILPQTLEFGIDTSSE